MKHPSSRAERFRKNTGFYRPGGNLQAIIQLLWFSLRQIMETMEE
jgi:hypothetical protein